MNAPGATEFGMPVCAVAMTPFPIVMCPATPTCPARVTAVLDRRAAGDADLGREQDVAPDGDAVRHLDQVVDLGAGTDPRLSHCRPVDRGLRADLDVVFDHHAADLGDLLVGAVGAPCEPEPVAADHRAVLNHDPVPDADALANRDAGVQDAVVANSGVTADHHVRVDRPSGPRSPCHRRPPRTDRSEMPSPS